VGTSARTPQRNFTDSDSRIMKKAEMVCIQAYSAQAVAEANYQIIVAYAGHDLLTPFGSRRRMRA
jgi:hypothetical protein